MTGPEHYQRAEQLLTMADDPSADHLKRQDRALLVAAAHAHAALAQVAATIRAGRPYADIGWSHVLNKSGVDSL